MRISGKPPMAQLRKLALVSLSESRVGQDSFFPPFPDRGTL